MGWQDDAFKYRAVEDYLRGGIARGAYEAGQPHRIGKQTFGNVLAVPGHGAPYALSKLEDEGLIERRQGRRS